ncbi:uncharacterized protein SCHCODRAFT_02644677 [Schizophyllum commune H4-8]|uniref:DH domain-containing protein n=1 Tax=Schizophyllum commune (strain H4-8 / FGSC 9210) TaxID=578458 RepID=D8QKW1_SCHCM|nr:uncharacterized protein SCHCODRAFT_02644677 [Schizophyllum commune H4-8]KAI5885408.1 hypothetical protein SCHCODRAFT_02644677 [Schizophyllum commune H4-8]
MHSYSSTYSPQSPGRSSSVAFIVPSHMPASSSGSLHSNPHLHRQARVSTQSSYASSPSQDPLSANPSATPPRNKLRKGKSIKRYLAGVQEGTDAEGDGPRHGSRKGKQRAGAGSRTSIALNSTSDLALPSQPPHGFSFIVEEDVENSNFPYDLSGDNHPARQSTYHANVVGEMALEGRRVAAVGPSDQYTTRSNTSRADSGSRRGRQSAPASEEPESSSSLARRMSMGGQADGMTRRKRSLSFGRRKSGKKTREEAPPLPGPQPSSPREPPTSTSIFPPHPAVSPPSRSPSRASGLSTPRSPYSPMHSPSAASSTASLARSRSISRSPVEPVPPLPTLVFPPDMPETSSNASQALDGTSSPSLVSYASPSLGSSSLASSDHPVTWSHHSPPSIHVSSSPYDLPSTSSGAYASYSAPSRSVSTSVVAPSVHGHLSSPPRRSFSTNSHWYQAGSENAMNYAEGRQPPSGYEHGRGHGLSQDPWEALTDASYSPRRSPVQIRVDIAPPASQLPISQVEQAEYAHMLHSHPPPLPYHTQPSATHRNSDAAPPTGSMRRRLTLTDQRASSRVSMAEQRVLGEDGEFKSSPRRLKRKHPPTASKNSLQLAGSELGLVRRSSTTSNKSKGEQGPGYHEIQAAQDKPRRPSFLSRISDFARGKKKKATPDVGVRANEALFVDDSSVQGGRMSLGEGYANSEPGHGGPSWASMTKSKSVAGHGEEVDNTPCSPLSTEEDGREWGTDIGHDACVSATVMEEEFRKLMEDRKWANEEKGKARADTLRGKSVDTMRAGSSSMHTRSSETMRTNILAYTGASTHVVSEASASAVSATAGVPERLPAYEEAVAGPSTSPIVASSDGSSTPRTGNAQATSASPTPTPSPTSASDGVADLPHRRSGSSQFTPAHRRSYSDSDSWRAPSAALEVMLDQSLSPATRSASRGSLDALRMLSPLPPSPSSSWTSKHSSVNRLSTISPTSSVSSTGRAHNKLVKKSRRPSVHLLDSFMTNSQRSSTEPKSASGNPRSPIWLNTPPGEHSATLGGITATANAFISLQARESPSNSPVLADSPMDMDLPPLPVADCQYCSPRDERDDAFSHLHVPDRPELRARPSASDVRSTRAMRRWTVSALDQPRTPGDEASDESDWGESEHEEEEQKAAEVLAVAANKPLPSSTLLPPSPSMPSLAYFGRAAERQQQSYFGVKDKSLPPTPGEQEDPEPRQQRVNSMHAPRRPQLRPLSVMSPVPAVHDRQAVSSPPTRTRFGSMSGHPRIFEVAGGSDESSSDERDDHVFDQDDEPETATPGTSAGTSSLGHGQWDGLARSASKSKTYSSLRVIPLPSDAAHTHLLHITTELLVTEKHYVSMLRLLLVPGSTQTPAPPLMRTYVQELVNVCDGLVRSIEGRHDLPDGHRRSSSEADASEGGARRRGGEHKRPEPPNPAVACQALITHREDVEGAYVRWCGVVGGWFVGPSENGGASIGRSKRRLSKSILTEGVRRRSSIIQASEEPDADKEESREQHVDPKEQQPAPEQGDASQEGAVENASAESGGERPSLASHKSSGRRTHAWRKSVPSFSALQMQLSSARKEEGGVDGRDAGKETGSGKAKEHGSGKAQDPAPRLSRRERKERQRKLPTVRELAILPTQRVMRYVLLYRDLLAHTPQTSPIRPLVQSAVDVAASIAAKCDRAQDTAEFFHRAM